MKIAENEIRIYWIVKQKKVKERKAKGD